VREIEPDAPLAFDVEVDVKPGTKAQGSPERAVALRGPPAPFAPHPEAEYALKGFLSGGGFRIHQQLEASEVVFGFQRPNDYFVKPFSRSATVRVTERGGTVMSALARNLLGGFRTVSLDVMGGRDMCVLEIELKRRPPPWNRLVVRAWNGEELGTIEQRFAWFGTRYDLLPPGGERLLTVTRRWFRMFRFDVHAPSGPIGTIEKQWGGLLKEMYAQADDFHVRVDESYPDPRGRLLLLAAVIAIDFVHFERPRQGGYFAMRAMRD
jgi:hypothetical protein